ncbi:MAG: response regulator transcription factor [Bacteroidota bacterium]
MRAPFKKIDRISRFPSFIYQFMTPIQILIVEDNSLNATILEAHLQDIGYQHVTKVRTGERALEIVAQVPPDIALLDIDLSEARGQMNGIELGLKLRTSYQFPLVFITAFQDRKTMEMTRSVRPDGYLTKPVSEAGLAFTIEEALSKASERFIRPKPLPEPETDLPEVEGTSFLLEDSLFVKMDQSYQKLSVDDIQFIEADAQYLRIQREIESLLVSTNLANFSRQFEHPSLLRISRSHIINIDYITGFEENMVMVAGRVFNIGKTYRAEVQKRFRFLKTTRKKKKDKDNSAEDQAE